MFIKPSILFPWQPIQWHSLQRALWHFRLINRFHLIMLLLVNLLCLGTSNWLVDFWLTFMVKFPSVVHGSSIWDESSIINNIYICCSPQFLYYRLLCHLRTMYSIYFLNVPYPLWWQLTEISQLYKSMLFFLPSEVLLSVKIFFSSNKVFRAIPLRG